MPYISFHIVAEINFSQHSSTSSHDQLIFVFVLRITIFDSQCERSEHTKNPSKQTRLVSLLRRASHHHHPTFIFPSSYSFANELIISYSLELLVWHFFSLKFLFVQIFCFQVSFAFLGEVINN